MESLEGVSSGSIFPEILSRSLSNPGSFIWLTDTIFQLPWMAWEMMIPSPSEFSTLITIH